MPISKTANKMPLQDPKVRAKNFDEVALGYDENAAINESSRCMNCKGKPCSAACPVNVDIPAFLSRTKTGDFKGAYDIISKTNSLPAVCGRVCPQENQCEGACLLGKKNEPVSIGRVERFIADQYIKSQNTSSSEDGKNRQCIDRGEKLTTAKYKVAVVGSGPSGLTCAGDLIKQGIGVTIFEALHETGGVLVYGIPEFRLPKAIVKREVDGLKALGVEIQTNVVIGKTLTIDELFEMGYDAVFIGTGAGLPIFMNIEGESLRGVYSANEYLTRSNLMKAYQPQSVTPIMRTSCVAVIGGGNVAMDAARTALRMGAEKVYIIYRRSFDELPARCEEVHHAIEEGVELKLLTNPTRILGYNNPDDKKDQRNGSVRGIECIQMELGETDESGRRTPVPIAGSEFTLDVDCVIVAIGTQPNPLIKSTTDGLSVNRRGGIVINEHGLTSKANVYAGGDAVTGAATVISAMGAGKVAAQAIIDALSNKSKIN